MSVRAARHRTTRRVLVHGLPYFGRMFAKLMSGDGWEFRYYADAGIGQLLAMGGYLSRCDLAYQIGGRVAFGKFLRAAKFMGKEKIVVHWCGSDTFQAKKDIAEGNTASWIMQKLHHWGESDAITQEVAGWGLSCESVPLPSVHIPRNPSPLPFAFSVLCYVPRISRSQLYGLDTILEVARDLREIPFDLVGLPPGAIPNQPPNLHVHGHVADLSDFYRSATVLWRPVRHDGLSFMVLEALGHGRHVLWSYAFPGCVQVTGAAQAKEQISRLHQLHREQKLDLNREGAQVIADKYLPQRIKEDILSRLERILES